MSIYVDLSPSSQLLPVAILGFVALLGAINIFKVLYLETLAEKLRNGGQFKTEYFQGRVLCGKVVFHWRGLYRESTLTALPEQAMKLLPVRVREH